MCTLGYMDFMVHMNNMNMYYGMMGEHALFDCMVVIINISNGSKEPLCGYLKVRISLYTQVIIWVNSI